MASNLGPGVVEYVIDGEDRLVYVNDVWHAFARDNGAGDLSFESVFEKPLWPFIADEETRRLYRLILQRVRGGGKSRSVPFRCDAPGLRRHMELEMQPLERGAVRFLARTVREEFRDPIWLLEESTKRKPQALSMCSWCKKVRLPGGQWVEVEEAILLMNVVSASASVGLASTVCSACLVSIHERFGSEKAPRRR